MAFAVGLAQGGDFITDVNTLSFLNSAAGWNMIAWNQAAGEGPQTEIITFDQKGDSQDLVAWNLVLLEDYMRAAEQAKSNSAAYVVWLRAQMQDEIAARQSLVYKIGYPEPLPFYSPPMSPGSFLQDGKIAIERAPWWEPTSEVVLTLSGISSVGGMSSLQFVDGSLPARIGAATFIGASSAALTEFWGGFLTDANRPLEHFTSPWNLYAGTASTDTEALSEGGESFMATSFATNATLQPRVTLTPYQISSSYYTELRGTYNILIRALAATGTTARLRVSCGLGSSWQINNLVTVADSHFQFYEAGQITIPAGGRGSPDVDAIRATTLRIEAERTVGSGPLYMSHLIAIPSDFYFHIGGGSGNNTLALITNPFGIITGYTYSGSNVNGLADITGSEARTAAVPQGHCVLILAAQQATESVLANTANVELAIFPRYRTLQSLADKGD